VIDDRPIASETSFVIMNYTIFVMFKAFRGSEAKFLVRVSSSTSGVSGLIHKRNKSDTVENKANC
jgi:hypothetical protein